MKNISTEKSCYICKNRNFRKRPGTVRDMPSLDIIECASCGLVCLSDFSHINDSFYENSQMISNTCGTIEKWTAVTERDDNRRFDTLRETIKHKKILDFGCGNGNFLKKCLSVTENPIGVELDRGARTHISEHGINVYPDLTGIPQETKQRGFDYITLFHVLEHLPDPVKEIQKLKDYLSLNGRIIIEIPHADDALLTVYKCRAFMDFTYWSCHLYLFNENTIKTVCERAGCRIESIQQIQRYGLANHLYWLSHAKPGGHEIWAHLENDKLNCEYKKMLAKNKICDSLLVTLKKAEKV